MKILIVEDDIFLAKLHKKKLAEKGYDVLFEKDGQGVLDTVKKEHPDLVILDLIMPIKDGFAVLKELKDDAETKDVEVIVLSALGSDSDIKQIMELGARDYFVKSNISLADFISYLDNMAQEVKTEKEAAADKPDADQPDDGKSDAREPSDDQPDDDQLKTSVETLS